MSSSSDSWKDTALIALLAAGIGGFICAQILSKNDNGSREEDLRRLEYYNSTFLQNERTVIPKDEMEMVESRGWSMAEAVAAAQKESEKAAKMSPREVLISLQKGNSRFWSGHASRPEKSAFSRRALISQQFPSTAVLGCSDSRVPVEIVFDQGLGDMFVVRVAGNCLGMTTEASLQYAVHHLGVKVLLVMGHEGCGAVKAAGLPLEKINQEPKTLATVLKDIKICLPEEEISSIFDARARDREAVAYNVKNQVIKLVEDPAILAKINEGKLKVVGAFYEISSGIVDFFMQVARDEGGEFKPSPGVQSRYNPVTKEVVYAS